ncbi:MAG: hypothetical protein AVDCRST_MAG31-805 [uncultured Sphingomonas sp.]|uniref:Uncharacterized protein n=1 Tax=uncultured Sphingomonas sp. TaxID=158754 RepID=A0A6J4SXA7_9SPHN|nr:MAG: hypothetical protein AVDCRST_MAG31-805 [uncultured Sphingomonas sp.]
MASAACWVINSAVSRRTAFPASSGGTHFLKKAADVQFGPA